ncbi:MAG: AMP-binding protein [Acidimicrobiales bacterium]
MNLAQIIEPHDGSAVAFRFRGESITYGELRARCASTRQWLVGRGVAPGDRVALVIGGTPDFAVWYLAVLGTGAIAVPLNPNSPVAELDREVQAVRASLVVVAGRGAHEPAGAGAIGTDQNLAEELAGIGHEVVSLADDRASFSHPEGAEAPIAERRADDEAVFLFTSGTAGSPRPAILTHGSLLSNIEQVEMRVGLGARPDDVGILAVPPFHILGLNAVLGVQLHAGARLVLLERFDAATTLHTMAFEKVTLLAGVPQLFSALADLEGATGSELASVRLACSGGAPLTQTVADRFEEKFSVPLWQGYGLTEASPTVSFPDLSLPRQVLSVGVPLPGVEVRVVDEAGDDVETGDPGEILVRGPNVFAGYFEDGPATRAALDKSGWLHTGDVAVMTEGCTLTLVDRQKDLIIVSGFNVFPAEVEQVLESHPLVEEAAVVGVPDEDHGESVRAFVVRRALGSGDGAARPEAPGDSAQPSEEDLLQHCALYLARYKCPTSITFAPELPRGVQGKVLRRAVG